jgi:hypothetical protein
VNLLTKLPQFNLQNFKIKDIPPLVVFLSLFMSVNALMQAIGDAVLETLILSGLFVKIPFRIDFISLTTISAILAWHTFRGIQRKEFDVTHDATQVSLVVELALVIGDLYFIITYFSANPAVLWIRLPFLVLTTINVLIVLYIIIRLKLFPPLTPFLDKNFRYPPDFGPKEYVPRQKN